MGVRVGQDRKSFWVGNKIIGSAELKNNNNSPK